jgi:DNA-binding CsgD family transcriptional regulator
VSPKQRQRRYALALSFGAFAAWLLQFPQLALSDSSDVFNSLAGIGVFFALALALSLLFHQRIARIRTSQALATASVLAAGASLAFISLTSSPARLAAFSLMVACSAFLLVGWAQRLQRLTESDILRCCLSGLIAVSAFGIIIYFLATLFGFSANLRNYTHVSLALLSLMLLPMAAYFLISDGGGRGDGRSKGDERDGGDGGDGGRGEGNGGGSRMARERTEGASVRPGAADGMFVAADLSGAAGLSGAAAGLLGASAGLLGVALPVCAIAAGFVGGFIYSPYMFDFHFVQLTRLSVCAIVAVLIIGIGNLRITAPIRQLIIFFLAFVALVLGLVCALIGQDFTGYALGALAAAFDLLFLISLAALATAGKHGKAGYPFWLFALLGTGFFWARGLGAFLQATLGYASGNVTAVSAIALAVICISLFLGIVIHLRPEPVPASSPLQKPVAAKGAVNAVVGDADAARAAKLDASATEAANCDAGAVSEAKALAPAAAKAATRGMKTDDAGMAAEGQKSTGSGDSELLNSFKSYGLTAREQQIILLMLKGCTATNMEARLAISQNTIRWHLTNAYRKCGVASKSELIELSERIRQEPLADPDKTRGDK